MTTTYTLPGCCFRGTFSTTDGTKGGTMTVTEMLAGTIETGMTINGRGPLCGIFASQTDGTPGGVGTWNVGASIFASLGVPITDDSRGENIVWAAGFGGTNSGVGCGEIGSHALGQTWHHVVNEQQVHVVFDTAWLRRCGVMVQDDVVGVDADLVSTMTAFPPVIPLDHGFILQAMGTTGDQAQLGLQPTNVAIWMISQEPSDYLACAAAATQACSIPMFFRDAATGQWLSLYDHPSLWVGSNPSSFAGAAESPLAALRFDSQLNGWGVDVSHNGDYFFTLWVLTGRMKWLDGLECEPQACFTSVDVGGLGSPPQPNEFGTGAVLPSHANYQGLGETRGQAWTLRYELLAAAWTLDSHDHDITVNTAGVTGNLASVRSYMNAIQTTPAAPGTVNQQGELYMWMGGNLSYGSPPTGILSTFSQAYVVEALCWCNRLGFPCLDVIEAMVGYLSGPMVHADVFPAWLGGQYLFPIGDDHSTIFTRYADVSAFLERIGQLTPDQIALPFPGTIAVQDNIIWSEVRGALAMALTETGDQRCQVGLDYIAASTQPVNPKGLGLTPYNFPRHAGLR